MKVLLLIIAIYALIFNQASKNADVKASMNVKYLQKKFRQDDNIYLHRGSVPVQNSPLRHISDELINPVMKGYMFHPALMRENESQQSIFYPIYCPNAVNIDAKRS